MREHTEERLGREWSELYSQIKGALSEYGRDDMEGGDYFVVDEIFSSYVHQIEIHKLHILQPHIIRSIQDLLKEYPDWEIEITISIPQENINVDPGEGLTLRDTEIVDALDRELLPIEYRDLKYEGSRPPSGLGDIAIFRDC